MIQIIICKFMSLFIFQCFQISVQLISQSITQIQKMRPSPFAGKIKRKEIKIQRRQDNEGRQSIQKKEEHQKPSHQPKFTLNKGPKKNKEIKNVYDALKDQDPENEVDVQQSVSKNISLKPNLKLKGGKKIKLGIPTPSVHQNQGQDNREEESKFNISMASKPKLFGKGNMRIGSHRENSREKSKEIQKQEVLIEEQNKANFQQESFEGSVSQSQSLSIAPKFKIKNKLQHQQAPIIQQNYEQEKGNAYSNFANIQIEQRQINLQPTEHKVSQVKIEKQYKRATQLSRLLNLEIDLFEETLNISAVTPYQIYISKIKSGSLKNSNDQAFDEKTVSSCQTLPLQYEDFVNQCPQDYHTDNLNILSNQGAGMNDQEEAFIRFMQKISPVVEELIKPSNSIVMPPIFLLALKPEFIKFMNCPFPVFLYKSDFYSLGILIIGEKLYITESQLTTVISIGNYLIGGTKDGNLVLWTGKNNKTSKLYEKIYTIINSTNFQLPQYETNELDRFSIYATDLPIVQFLDEGSINNDEFISLDENGRMIRWRIQNVFGRKNELKPISSVDLARQIQRESLISYSIKKRNDMFFINSSAGIIVWNGDQVCQKLLNQCNEKILDFCLPHRSYLVYSISSDNKIRIYDQNFQNALMKLQISPEYTLQNPENLNSTSLIVPQLDYENKKVSLTAHIYVNTAHNQILHYKIIENSNQPQLLTKYHKNDAKNQRNIIFQGINVIEEGIFEQVTLWRDLKCTSQIRRMNCDLTPSVSNIKHILEQNRRVFALLEAEVTFPS